MHLRARDFSAVVVANLLRLLGGRHGDKLATCSTLPTHFETDIRVWSLHLCKRKKKTWTHSFPDTKGHLAKEKFIQTVRLPSGKDMVIYVFIHSVIPTKNCSYALDRFVYIPVDAGHQSQIDIFSPCVIHYVPAEPRPHQRTTIPSCANLSQEILRPCHAYHIVMKMDGLERAWCKNGSHGKGLSWQSDLANVLEALPEGSAGNFLSKPRPHASFKVVSVEAHSNGKPGKDAVDKMEFSSSQDGEYARKFLTPIYKEGTKFYMNNANTHAGLCMVRDTSLGAGSHGEVTCTFPYSVNQVRGPISRLDTSNSYVCSPVNHYLTYAIEEETRKLPLVLRKIALFLFLPVFLFFQLFMVDKVVYVNNWLLSTNLYPNVTPDGPPMMGAIIDHMKEKYPGHAIVFRSVDGFWNGHIKDALQSRGCLMAFSRKIFYQNMMGSYVTHSPSFQRDVSILRASPYKRERLSSSRDISGEELRRILDLYYKLYVEKYTDFNPLFTLDFLTHMLDNNLLTFILLRHKDTNAIDGVLGYFTRNGCITTPFVGYDTGLDQAVGLYRMLVAIVSLEGRSLGCMVNCSAGVGKFKASRAGIGVIEYNAVYLDHLPRWRGWPWRFIRWVGSRVVVPLIDKYNL